MIFSFFFYKQKTSYDMQMRDWSSNVCSSDLVIRKADEQRVAIVLGRAGLAIIGLRQPRRAAGAAVDRGPQHCLDILMPARPDARRPPDQVFEPALLLFLETIRFALLAVRRDRSDGRRVGQGGVSRCRSQGYPNN